MMTFFIYVSYQIGWGPLYVEKVSSNQDNSLTFSAAEAFQMNS